MDDSETRRLVTVLATARTEAEADAAWTALRPLGEGVVPFLAAAYPTASRQQGRVRLVFHSIRYARTSQAAFDLGMKAVNDRATLVRHRACQLLAYSLRRDAVAALEAALRHPDRETVDDARAALRAIAAGDHHRFVDPTGTGRVRWVVNPEDDHLEPPAPARWLRRLRRLRRLLCW